MCAAFDRPIKSERPSILNYIGGNILPLIDAARERRQKQVDNGSKGGATKKLTEEDNATIAQMRQQKTTQKEIAQYFGVSEDTIRRSKGWSDWRQITENTKKPAEPGKTNCEVLPELQDFTAKPSKTPQAPQNLYVYVYDYVYVDEYENEECRYTVDLEKKEIKGSEIVEEDLKNDPSLRQVLLQYPDYLTFPFTGEDGNCYDKQTGEVIWIGYPGAFHSSRRLEFHLEAAAQGYRLCK